MHQRYNHFKASDILSETVKLFPDNVRWNKETFNIAHK